MAQAVRTCLPKSSHPWTCAAFLECFLSIALYFRQRTKRSVYSVTMHVHARALVQRTSHRMWRTSHMHAAWPFWPRRLLLFCGSRQRIMALEEHGSRWAVFKVTGARTGGEPSGAHWDHRAEARDTAGGPGRYTNTGHGPGASAGWHRPRLQRLSRSVRLCPENPHIPMFVTAPVLEYLVVMEQVPPAPVVEYVTPATAVTYAHASPVDEYVTPARTVACAAPVTSRTAAPNGLPNSDTADLETETSTHRANCAADRCDSPVATLGPGCVNDRCCGPDSAARGDPTIAFLGHG